MRKGEMTKNYVIKVDVRAIFNLILIRYMRYHQK